MCSRLQRKNFSLQSKGGSYVGNKVVVSEKEILGG